MGRGRELGRGGETVVERAREGERAGEQESRGKGERWREREW